MGLNGVMYVKHFINLKYHTNEALSLIIDEHTHAHTPTSIGTHSFIKMILLQRHISIMMQSPVKSHAGTSLCPPSSLCHYPLRLSGFRKIEEGLKSFKEKQVGLETSQPTPAHSAWRLGLFAFPLCTGTWEPQKQPTPSEKMLGRVGLTLERRFKFNSSLWVPSVHSFIFPVNKVY